MTIIMQALLLIIKNERFPGACLRPTHSNWKMKEKSTDCNESHCLIRVNPIDMDQDLRILIDLICGWKLLEV